MNIIILSSMYPNSQIYMSGIFVHEHIKALQKLGVEITVFAPIPFSPWPLYLFSSKWKKFNSIPKEETIDGVKVVHTRYIALPNGLLKHLWPYFYVPQIYSFLKSSVKKTSIDFIHAHGSTPDDFAAKLLSQKLNIPYLLTVHGETVYMKKNQKQILKSIEAIKNARAVIGVSGNVIDRIKKLTGRHKDLFKIYNGFTPEQIKIEPIEKDNNELNILFGATLVERKGCAYLIEAFAKLVPSYNNVKLTIAGGGELFPKLVILSKELNVESKVDFLGAVSHDKMLKLMADCDVFVLPSWDEAFGVVYLEAMSFKKPIIGTIGEGISEIIKDGDNGLLVRPQNLDDIVEKLKLLIGSKELREKIGSKGFEDIKKLTWKNNAKQMLNVYEEFLSNYKNSKTDSLSSR